MTPCAVPAQRAASSASAHAPEVSVARCSTGMVVRQHVVMRIELTLDCTDLEATAAFWRSALGYTQEEPIEGPYLSLAGEGVSLTLQQVAEPKTVKNRMHLDLLVDDIDSELTRLEALGATRVTPTAREEFGQTWFVLTDPEGNEFCLAPDRNT